MVRRRRGLRIAHDDKRLRHHQPDARRAGLAGFRNRHTFQRWMVPYVVRRIAVGSLKQDVAAIEIDCCENPVRRPDDRQSLHIQAAALAGSLWWRSPGGRLVPGRKQRQILTRLESRIRRAAIPRSPDLDERPTLYAGQVPNVRHSLWRW